MKTSLGQLSLKYTGPKIWSNIPEKLNSSSPYLFGKKYKKVLLSRQTSCWSSFYMLVTFCFTFLLYACHILFDLPFICLSHSVWSSSYILVPYCNIALMPLFSLLSTSSYSPQPLYIGMLFPTDFCCCFYAYFTWRWFDAFCYF